MVANGVKRTLIDGSARYPNETSGFQGTAAALRLAKYAALLAPEYLIQSLWAAPWPADRYLATRLQPVLATAATQKDCRTHDA
jgi:hypothetical protein